MYDFLTPRLRTVDWADNAPSGRFSVLSAWLSFASCCLVPSQITSDFSQFSALSFMPRDWLQPLISAMVAMTSCLACCTSPMRYVCTAACRRQNYVTWRYDGLSACEDQQHTRRTSAARDWNLEVDRSRGKLCQKWHHQRTNDSESATVALLLSVRIA